MKKKYEGIWGRGAMAKHLDEWGEINKGNLVKNNGQGGAIKK